MDISHIRKLIKLIQSSDVTEIEVTEGNETIRISRQGQVAAVAAPVVTQYAAAPAPAAAPAADAPAEAESVNEAHIVKSPMVGTFYAAPNPDSDDFVSVGQKVKKGDTLCIIEAMKMMNTIEAEYAGTVEAILTDNATPVEFGQNIFVIAPSA
ncbi:acetyl-CoA carboxylase biotin carboxyl carrier protein [Mariprofundus sp. EBB-1]|uniref:acetyl-CoA carboxylase biotin carboxyl carrier protein n=1 Tax=Mariprofundus sp. EBB-1 TaxID=2650971 RepID=UPI000EF180CB|nr:acetyl-CoA carboxylase biotin carboxyl carrier protein [Mariprofundus sp. EBB-1]RLL49758.1 acetyl-CoA carboxylase biotin carboxyl carrier protein [Mariprofundus sp. EBB-1]